MCELQKLQKEERVSECIGAVDDSIYYAVVAWFYDVMLENVDPARCVSQLLNSIFKQFNLTIIPAFRLLVVCKIDVG